MDFSVRRQCEKLQKGVNTLESQEKFYSNKKETLLTSVSKTNAIYENVSKEIEDELSQISQALPKLLQDVSLI